jgi:hypothetical protein
MHERALARFLYEIHHHCTVALSAIDELANAARRLRAQPEESRDSPSPFMEPMSQLEDAERLCVFRSIYSALFHAGCVLTLLWPTGSGQQKRAREVARTRARKLRRELGLPDQEPPGLARDLRNSLAHFDERLDSWAASGLSVGSVADAVGPRTGIFAQLPDSAIHRWFDDNTFELQVFGRRYDLRAIGGSLEDISERARERLAQLWRTG